MKKLAILCVLVMAISLVPAFAEDTNNTTTAQKNLKHQYKHNNTQKNCTDCDNDGLKVNTKHQYKYKNGIKKSTNSVKSGIKAKNQPKYKYGLKNAKKTGKKSVVKKYQYKNTKKSQNKTSLKNCTGTCKA
ncbi:hypothetical protein [Methanobacterium oryzae]|uniref:hypothetical protein n=1 Tax=Methanobacterium oryzae TaxID=69540 RepID=UPI003D1D4D7F